MELTQVRPETTTARPEQRADTREWLNERIPGAVAAGVGIAWFVLMQVAFLLEPASSQPVPVIGLALEISMYVLLAAMVTGLVMQRRWGLVASLAGAVLATAASVACPVTGHHAFGAWWFAQMACMLTLVATSVVTLRHRYT